MVIFEAEAAFLLGLAVGTCSELRPTTAPLLLLLLPLLLVYTPYELEVAAATVVEDR